MATSRRERVTDQDASRFRRAVKIKERKEKPTTWIETYTRAEDVKDGDIVFVSEDSQPFIASGDSFPSSGMKGLTIVQGPTDYFFPSGMLLCVARPFDMDNPPVVERELMPWESPLEDE